MSPKIKMRGYAIEKKRGRQFVQPADVVRVLHSATGKTPMVLYDAKNHRDQRLFAFPHLTDDEAATMQRDKLKLFADNTEYELIDISQGRDAEDVEVFATGIGRTGCLASPDVTSARQESILECVGRQPGGELGAKGGASSANTSAHQDGAYGSVQAPQGVDGAVRCSGGPSACDRHAAGGSSCGSVSREAASNGVPAGLGVARGAVGGDRSRGEPRRKRKRVGALGAGREDDSSTLWTPDRRDHMQIDPEGDGGAQGSAGAMDARGQGRGARADAGVRGRGDPEAPVT